MTTPSVPEKHETSWNVRRVPSANREPESIVRCDVAAARRTSAEGLPAKAPA